MSAFHVASKKGLWNALKGKKTFLTAIAIGIIAILRFLNYIDDDTYLTLLGLLGAGGLAALRDSIK